MKQVRILHTTEYFYREPVQFGPHRALMRPREGHDVHIARGRFEIEPQAVVRWMRDVESNSVAVVTFQQPSNKLRISSEVDVDLFEGRLVECHIDPTAKFFPFHYAAYDELGLVPCQLPAYPQDEAVLRNWLLGFYEPGQSVETLDLLLRLNEGIFRGFTYLQRDDHGVQTPAETILKGSGSCRDYAVLMMEATRCWGIASRFVTGYVQMQEGQHGATHAWVEVYLPGVGWQGYDPTNNKLVGSEHISVAVAPRPEQASPLAGTWIGSVGAYEGMSVSVQVVEIGDDAK